MLSLGSCFASTVKFVLNQELKIDVKNLEIDLSGERRESHPTGLKNININLKITAEKLNTGILEKVIVNAKEKLCPVYSMINKDTAITVNYKIKQPETSSYCGVFCKSCPLYIGTTEEPERLELLAAMMDKKTEDLKCHGCRSDTVSYYCADCRLKNCAENRDLSNCRQCGEYPCSSLKEFQAEMPHRAELWDSLDILENEGYDSWVDKLTKNYTCSKCSTLNTAYDISCRSCGNIPGSDFYERNSEKIKQHLSRRK